MAKTKPASPGVIYVTVSNDQKARYDAAANAAGMSMREFAINALDAAVAQQSSTRSDMQLELLDGATDTGLDRETEISAMRQTLVSQNIRLAKIESVIEGLQKREGTIMTASERLDGLMGAMGRFHDAYGDLQKTIDRMEKNMKEMEKKGLGGSEYENLLKLADGQHEINAGFFEALKQLAAGIPGKPIKLPKLK